MRIHSRFCRATIVLAAAALCGCASPSAERPRDRDFLMAMSTGRRFFETAQYDLAAKSYQSALVRASVLDEPQDIADSAYNAAAALMADGRSGEARGYLREARAEFGRAGGAGAAEAWLLEARIAQAEGRRDEALTLADKALAALGTAGGNDLRARIHQVKAALACEGGDVSATKAALAMGLSAAEKLPETASARGLLTATAAAVSRREGAAAAAAAQYDRAAALLKGAAQYRDMAAAYAGAAEAYEAAGQPAAAGGRYYQAARSFAALGDLTNALKRVESALTMADKTSNQDLRDRTQFLFESIKRTVESGKKSTTTK